MTGYLGRSICLNVTACSHHDFGRLLVHESFPNRVHLTQPQGSKSGHYRETFSTSNEVNEFGGWLEWQRVSMISYGSSKSRIVCSSPWVSDKAYWGTTKSRVMEEREGNKKAQQHTNLMTPPTMAETIPVVAVRGRKENDDVT